MKAIEPQEAVGAGWDLATTYVPRGTFAASPMQRGSFEIRLNSSIRTFVQAKHLFGSCPIIHACGQAV